MALFDRLRYRLHMLWLALTLKPMAGAEDDPPDPEPKKDDPPKGGDPDPDPDPHPEPIKPEDDWQAKSRKHEREAKRLRKQLEERDKALKDRENADKSEQEKAIEAAREEGEKKARDAGEKERRADRLEVAVTRLAARGVQDGEGEDAKALRFADPEDALLRVERGISRGDIEADDIFDDEGRVKNDALTEALVKIAKANPHLVGEAERPKPKGDPDSRKGDPAQKDLEGMSPEDHARRKYGTPAASK